MTGTLGSEALRQRHDTYLTNHYISLHVTIVSLALGVAGFAAASLIAPSSRFHGYQVVFCVLWLASLLATAVAYAGTMIGAIVLPARVPAIVDLLLPLLLGMSEFLLFAILAYQAAGVSSPRAVLTGWWFTLGAFGFLAAASIWRAFHMISHAPDSAVRRALDRYLTDTRRDILAAATLGLLGVLVGSAHAIYGTMPIWVNYLLASIPLLFLLGALGSHRRVAHELRQTLAVVLDEG
jgi:hypothetical protein